MARSKVTITLDRDKAARAQSLLGARSTSEVIDTALDRLLRAERVARDIEAYRAHPQNATEVALASLGDTTGLDDDTDWEGMYEP